MDETNSKDGLTYSDRKVQINPGHPLYEWCSTVTSLSNNLYNASLFHIRQCMTGLKKTEEERQDLEKEVIARIDSALPLMNETRVKAWQKKKAKYDALDKEARKEKQEPKLSLFKAPTARTWMLSYNFLDGMFKVTQNPDYFARGLPRHTAQSIIKQACQDMKSFFEASKANVIKFSNCQPLARQFSVRSEAFCISLIFWPFSKWQWFSYTSSSFRKSF